MKLAVALGELLGVVLVGVSLFMIWVPLGLLAVGLAVGVVSFAIARVEVEKETPP